MTTKELATFIDWEGGIESAIRHGLDADAIKNKKIRLLWLNCVKALEAFDALQAALPEPK